LSISKLEAKGLKKEVVVVNNNPKENLNEI